MFAGLLFSCPANVVNKKHGRHIVRPFLADACLDQRLRRVIAVAGRHDDIHHWLRSYRIMDTVRRHQNHIPAFDTAGIGLDYRIG